MSKANEKLKTGLNLPWSFQTLVSLRVIGSAMAGTIFLIIFVVVSDPKIGYPANLVFGAIFLSLALLFLNLTFVRVRCSIEGIRQSDLLTQGKNLGWDEITKVELASGFRSGYVLWIHAQDKKISVTIQMYRKDDMLVLASLLQKKVKGVQVKIDLKKIEGSYF